MNRDFSLLPRKTSQSSENLSNGLGLSSVKTLRGSHWLDPISMPPWNDAEGWSFRPQTPFSSRSVPKQRTMFRLTTAAFSGFTKTRQRLL
ncbi:hypothetical protein [Vibrio nigripulchritudo]|uniref:hypothetical protein n=1 Tax=Vibrio nigripulchritudo TaxID=28173 RepID=UPI0011AE8EB2|nr:hypothetical protein [Vibrio nigripulchritudo]